MIGPRRYKKKSSNIIVILARVIFDNRCLNSDIVEILKFAIDFSDLIIMHKSRDIIYIVKKIKYFLNKNWIIIIYIKIQFKNTL